MATPKASTAVAKAKVNLPVDIAAMRAAEVAAIQKRIGAPSGDRILVTKGKTLKLPSGLEVEEMECVIVDFVSANYYYTQGYQRDNIIPPVCFSIGLEPSGMTPSDNSPDPQGGACATCWANQFKSAANGKGKACGNTRLLALLPTDADADTPLAIIKVSATGIKSFDGLVNEVGSRFGLPMREIVTKVSFSEDDYASLRFSRVGPAPKDLIALAWSRKEDAMTRLMTEPDVTAANDEQAKPAARKAAPAARKSTVARR